MDGRSDDRGRLGASGRGGGRLGISNDFDLVVVVDDYDGVLARLRAGGSVEDAVEVARSPPSLRRRDGSLAVLAEPGMRGRRR